jgi:cytidylate kinase
MTSQPVIITIDGPAGAGKSTVARALARRLGYAYIDTGAMYRAVALKALRAGVDWEDEEGLAAMTAGTGLELIYDDQACLQVILDGEDVSEAIRSPEVTNHTFYVARSAKVRAILVEWQQQMGRRRDVVIEGRDAGTVIFPHAAYKFYLDAQFTERSRRRMTELREKGNHVNEEHLQRELQERDHKDFTRKTGPLKMADDALLIDSTHLSVEGVVEEMLRCINVKGACRSAD